MLQLPYQWTIIVVLLDGWTGSTGTERPGVSLANREEDHIGIPEGKEDPDVLARGVVRKFRRGKARVMMTMATAGTRGKGKEQT